MQVKKHRWDKTTISTSPFPPFRQKTIHRANTGHQSHAKSVTVIFIMTSKTAIWQMRLLIPLTSLSFSFIRRGMLPVTAPILLILPSLTTQILSLWETGERYSKMQQGVTRFWAMPAISTIVPTATASKVQEDGVTPLWDMKAGALTDVDKLSSIDKQDVYCDFCHKMSSVRDEEEHWTEPGVNYKVNLPRPDPLLESSQGGGKVMFGPFDDVI